MLKIILSLILFVTIVTADIRIEKKSEGSYTHPTPEIREPLPNRIKYIKIRLPKRPMLEHRRLYRKLGILPEVTEYC
jgi:hypothetical protein